MEESKIICGESVQYLKTLPSDIVDLVVFSPPYDNLRDYNGYSFDIIDLGKELYRVLKEGGICAMVIQDQTIDGWKSLTSFRTIVDWVDKIGFGLFECCIYEKYGIEGAWWSKRFRVDHEYLPIFIKGKRPRHFDKTLIKIPTIHGGKKMKGSAIRKKDGTTLPSRVTEIQTMKCRGTIWKYLNGGDKNRVKRLHPATFPDRLPYDIISVFSKEGDLVLDPMCGSGSTCVAASILSRNYIGIDISEEYVEITKKRISNRETNL
jgi:site-specific DNA-methyltransferase (adenine-specific)